EVIGYDPQAANAAADQVALLQTTEDMDEALNGADAVVVLTEWNSIRNIDWQTKKGLLASPVVVDLRNLYSPQTMADHGIHYASMGRPLVAAN
ncbi:MAG: UDP-glucose/GDP-mannose dehydrogenase family protein, partial [Pseudomonadota bacterium]